MDEEIEEVNGSASVIWNPKRSITASVWGPGILLGKPAPDPDPDPEPEYPEAVLVGRATMLLQFLGTEPGQRTWQGMATPDMVEYQPGESIPDLAMLIVTIADELQITTANVNTGVHLGSMVQTQLAYMDTANPRMLSMTIPALGTPENKDLPSQLGLQEVDDGVNALVSGSLYYSYEPFLTVEANYPVTVEIWRFPKEEIKLLPGKDRELPIVNSTVPKQEGTFKRVLRSVGLRGFFRAPADDWLWMSGKPISRNAPIDADVIFLNMTEHETAGGNLYAFTIQLLLSSMIVPLAWYPPAYKGDVLINGIKVNQDGPINLTPQVVIPFVDVQTAEPEVWGQLYNAVREGKPLTITLDNVVEQ